MIEKIIDNSIIQNPMVSVIIPSFNRENLIKECLDSVLSQECKFGFEIIIGDDCSSDHTREILIEYQNKHPDKIILLFHEKNIGLGANWAVCVKHCRGKYIANCDCDDYWHNNKKLQLQVDFLESHPEYGVCHTDYRKHHRLTGKITNEKASNSIVPNESLQESIMHGNFRCCNATVMYRKSVIDNYLNLDDYIKHRFTLQDWNTWMILSHYVPFYCMPVSTATFGIETESITRPNSFEKLELRLKKEKSCYKYICDLFPNKYPYIEEEYDEYVNNVLLSMAYEKNDFLKAKEIGSKIKNTGLKIKCSQNILMFQMFRLIKKLKLK